MPMAVSRLHTWSYNSKDDNDTNVLLPEDTATVGIAVHLT
jgi:hypothetical protein